MLGLDPGTRKLGYGLVDWGAVPRFVLGGTIEATRDDKPGARVAEIGQELDGLLREVGSSHAITRVGIESGFMGGKSAKSDLMLANARGVVLYIVATVLRIEPVFVAPSTIKKVVAGHGHAEKPQVQAAVKATLRMQCLPGSDTADALAVAIAAAGIEA